MPLLSTLGSAGVQSYGTSGIQPGGSFYFVGGSQYLTFSGTNLTYGTANFTIEFWWKPVVSLTGIKVLYAQWFGSNNYLWIYQRDGQIVFATVGGAIRAFGGTLTLNTWNHIALVRNSGSARLFVNGVAYTSATCTNNYATNTTYNPCVGQWYPGNSTYPALGYLTNLRISKSALYTTNFTPSKVPFTRTSQGATASLLLNVKSSGTFITDSSANAITVTNNLVTYDTQSPYVEYYVTPPTVTVVSATVTPSTFTGSEGSAISFTIVGTNTTNGTYYYTIEQASGSTAIATTDFTSASLSGSFTITSGSGSFNITPSKDLTTEGTETFSVAVRQTSITGPIIGASDEITITDVSLTPTVTPASSSLDEGASLSFTAANLGIDGTYYWTINNTTTANADFSTTSGSFTVSGSTGGIENGTGTFSITTVADRTTEGAQTFTVSVRSGSISGTVIATSSSVTINDTSLTPFVNITGGTNIAELAGGLGGFPTFTTLQAGNLGPAGTYYWTILNGTTANTDFSAASGSFTTSTLNGTGSFTVTAVADSIYDGSETFQVEIRSGSTSGTVLATSGTITIWDSSVSVTVTPNPISETNGLQITVTTPVSSNGIVPGQYYLTFIAGTASASDISGLPFPFNITGTASLNLSGVSGVLSADGAEGAETFSIGVRQGNPTTGTLVGQSATITINASAT